MPPGEPPLTPPGPSTGAEGTPAEPSEPERPQGGLSVDDWIATQQARPTPRISPGRSAPSAPNPYASRSGVPLGAGPSYDPDTSRKMAGWALALSLLFCIPFGFLVAIGLAIAVLVRSRAPGDHGRGRAIAALVISGLIVVANIAYVVVAVVGGVDTTERDSQGHVTDGGTVTVGKLRVGDCFSEPKLDDLPDDGGEGESPGAVDVVPCAEAHQAEVYQVIELGGGDFPGEDGVRRRLRDCLPAFAQYVGRPYRKSVLDIVTFFPTSASWRFGDRSIVCSLISRDLSDLSSSQRNARR